MKTYTPQVELAPTDLEDIPYFMDRYCANNDNIRLLRGGIARRTAYTHAERWIDAGYAERRQGGQVVFTQKAFHHFDPPYKFHQLGDQNLAHHCDVNMVELYFMYRTDMIVTGSQGQRLTRHMLHLPPEDPKKGSEKFPPVCIPDLILEIDSLNTGRFVQTAVEVQRSYITPDIIDRKIEELAKAYEEVFFVATHQQNVYNLIKARIKAHSADIITRTHLWKLDTIRAWQETLFSSKPKKVQASGAFAQLVSLSGSSDL